jgi:general secretion pathway protein G
MTTYDEPIVMSDESGFTLVELLIVITVIAIMAAIVVFALGSVTSQTRSATCKSDAETILTAVKAYDAQQSTALAVETSASGFTLGTPSTYWASGTQGSLLISDGYIQQAPQSTNGWAMSLSTTTPGDVMIYVPATSATGVDYNSETTTNGCNAL